MDSVSAKDLGITIKDVPENFRVVINREELESANDKRSYLLVNEENINDEMADILTGGIDFDSDTLTIKPFMVHIYDENGVYKKNALEHFPINYRKKKSDLIILK